MTKLLQYPGPDGLRPSELAAQTRITKQALNYLLGQVEGLGYLERRAEPGDQRSKRIGLTARGRRVMSAIREIVADVEAEWQQQLGPDRFADLRELLADLNALATAPEVASPD